MSLFRFDKKQASDVKVDQVLFKMTEMTLKAQKLSQTFPFVCVSQPRQCVAYVE